MSVVGGAPLPVPRGKESALSISGNWDLRRCVSRRDFLALSGMRAAALTLGGLSAGAALAQPKASGGGSEREESKLNTTNVVLWNAAALEAIRSTHPGPPMVARALAIVHTCIYDAWAAYDSEAVGTLLGGDLRRPVDERTLDNKNEAISYAARAALVDLYPTEKARFDDLLTSASSA